MSWYNLFMEARFGNVGKLIAVIMAIFLAFQTYPIALRADDETDDQPLVASFLWEKSDHKWNIIGAFDGKILILTRIDDGKSAFELVDVETGENLWDGEKNDLKDLGNSWDSYFLHDWGLLKDLKLAFFRYGEYENEKLYCFDAQNGELKWSSLEGQEWNIPIVHEDKTGYSFSTIVPGTYKLTAFNLTTGEIVSENELDESALGEHFSGYPYLFGKIKDNYYIYTVEHIYRLNLAKLKLIRLVDYESYYPDKRMFIQYGDQILYVKFGQNNKNDCVPSRIVSLDENGKEKWSQPISGYPVISGDFLFAKYDNLCGDQKNSFLSAIDMSSGKLINRMPGVFDYDVKLVASDDYVGIVSFESGRGSTIDIFDRTLTKLGSIFVESMQLSSGDYSALVDYDNNSKIMFVGEHALFDSGSLICYMLTKKSEARLELNPAVTEQNVRVVCTYNNNILQVYMNNEGLISDVKLIDLRDGKSVWIDDPPLRQLFIGGRIEEISITTIDKQLFAHIYSNGKRLSMACFDIESGKRLWDSSLLKDLKLPTKFYREYFYSSSINDKELRFFEVYLSTGKIKNRFKLTGQKLNYDIVSMNYGQMAVINDGLLSMYHFRTGYNAWRSKDKPAEDFDLATSVVFGDVFMTATGSNDKNCPSKLVGSNFYDNIPIWSLDCDPDIKVKYGHVFVTSGFSCSKKDNPQLLQIDPQTGEIMKSNGIDYQPTKETKVTIIPVNYKIAVFIEEPGKTLWLQYFDEDLQQLGKWEFKGKNLLNSNYRLDTMYLNLKDCLSGFPELQSVSFAWQQKTK